MKYNSLFVLILSVFTCATPMSIPSLGRHHVDTASNPTLQNISKDSISLAEADTLVVAYDKALLHNVSTDLRTQLHAHALYHLEKFATSCTQLPAPERSELLTLASNMLSEQNPYVPTLSSTDTNQLQREVFAALIRTIAYGTEKRQQGAAIVNTTLAHARTALASVVAGSYQLIKKTSRLFNLLHRTVVLMAPKPPLINAKRVATALAVLAALISSYYGYRNRERIMQAIKNTLTSIPLVTHGIVSGWQHRDEVVDAARRRAPMAAGLAFLHAGGNHVVANGAYLIGRVGAENLAASARGYAGRAKALFWETIAGMGNRRGANADA